MFIERNFLAFALCSSSSRLFSIDKSDVEPSRMYRSSISSVLYFPLNVVSTSMIVGCRFALSVPPALRCLSLEISEILMLSVTPKEAVICTLHMTLVEVRGRGIQTSQNQFLGLALGVRSFDLLVRPSSSGALATLATQGTAKQQRRSFL